MRSLYYARFGLAGCHLLFTFIYPTKIAYGDIACNAAVSDDFIYLYMRVHIHSMNSLNHNFINL